MTNRNNPIRKSMLFPVLPYLTLALAAMSASSCQSEKAVVYKDAHASVEARVEDLLSRMTLEEKIGQMAQVSNNSLDSVSDLSKYSIGSILAIPLSRQERNDPLMWTDLYDSLQREALKNRLGIPLIAGIDAVHGHNNVKGAVIFPHNIGMGCVSDTSLIRKAAEITALEVAATGFDWTFAPCVAVSRNERWGRTYESFSENTERVAQLGVKAIEGFQQGDLSSPVSVMACAKHYLGDGGTRDGKDRGDMVISEDSMRMIHLPPYKAAVDAGVGSVMISFSKWNGIKVLQQKYMITHILKQELGFGGIVITDYGDIKNISKENYEYSAEAAINAGVDMSMMAEWYKKFLETMPRLVAQGRIPESRIDDAVRRILKKKFELGLFESPFADRALLDKVGAPDHRALARQCVRESIVILKNENNVLPLSSDMTALYLGGRRADDLGAQCGGWSIRWAGGRGQITEGTTVKQALEKDFPTIKLLEDGKGGKIGLVVIGERPYAEIQGDREDLHLDPEDIAAVKAMKKKGIPVVVVLFSGRPMILEDILEEADAIVAAWLPGTEGQGITDVLFGKAPPKGKLGFSWPRTMEQIPVNQGDAGYDPLFPVGHGLTY